MTRVLIFSSDSLYLKHFGTFHIVAIHEEWKSSVKIQNTWKERIINDFDSGLRGEKKDIKYPLEKDINKQIAMSIK